MPKTLDTIKEIAKITHKPYADREEVAKMLTDMLKSVSKVVRELRADVMSNKAITAQEIKNMATTLSSTITQLQKTVGDNQRKHKEELRDALDSVAMDMARIVNLIPQEQDLTYLERSIRDLEKKLKREMKDSQVELDTAEQIRDKLETLDGEERLDVKAIRGLEELLKKIESKIQTGGSMRQDVTHWARHEAFTMNGSDTSVTLAQGVGAGGTACIVRYQGQTLDLTTHYTVSGNKITLVGFIPEADTIISVTYWP